MKTSYGTTVVKEEGLRGLLLPMKLCLPGLFRDASHLTDDYMRKDVTIQVPGSVITEGEWHFRVPPHGQLRC